MHQDPLSLFHAITDALQRRDWQAVALLCDPASLVAFKRRLLEQYAPTEPAPLMTVEEWLRYQPDTPREVAEYQVAQMNKGRDPATRLQEIPGIRSVEALKALSPPEVFAAWLDSRHPESQFDRLRELGQISDTVADEMGEAIRRELRPRYVPLAAVPDGGKLTHIVVREERTSTPESMDGEERAWFDRLSAAEQELTRDLAECGDPQLTTCRRQPDGEWRMLAGYEFLNLGDWTVFVNPEPPPGSEAEGE